MARVQKRPWRFALNTGQSTAYPATTRPLVSRFKQGPSHLRVPLRDQLDIDSFDFLDVVIRLHDKLGVDVPEADYQNLATLDSAIDYLASRLGTS